MKEPTSENGHANCDENLECNSVDMPWSGFLKIHNIDEPVAQCKATALVPLPICCLAAEIEAHRISVAPMLCPCHDCGLEHALEYRLFKRC